MIKWLALLAFAAVCVWVMQTPGLRPVLINMPAPPQLTAEPMQQSLGVVPTDTHQSATFQLTNTGGRPLDIRRVDTSCGCTAVRLSKTHLMPGDTVPLQVVLDTSIKLGHVNKTITLISNDPDHPQTSLTLSGEVVFQMAGHARLKVKDPLVLFKGSCAACHVKRGIGKTGEALFVADCAMCHGAKAQGGVGPGLMTHPYDNPAEFARLRRVIAEGSPHSPEMPPFSQAHGGPLSDSEIDSLMTWLRYTWQQKHVD